MKKNVFIIAIFVFPLFANSQIRKGISPYRFNQAMYVGANIGPNAFFADGFSDYGLKGSIGLSESVFIGYDLTELFGVRAMGSFSTMNWPGISSGTLRNVNFSTISMSFEVMYNVSNTFNIYNLNRPWDVSVFGGLGYIAREKAVFQNEYIGMLYKAGIQVDYRINYKFDINATLTGNIVNEQFNEYKVGRNFDAFPEIKLGLTYHIRIGGYYR